MSSSREKVFYLLPNLLSEHNVGSQIPPYVAAILEQIEVLWVENPKPARAFIKACETERPISSFEIFPLPKHDKQFSDRGELLQQLDKVQVAGFLSDAGLPCIADPGALLVNIARKAGFRIAPLVGPSSLMLALMGAGFNGQQFVFHGYLPIQTAELRKALKGMEHEANTTAYTQIFIETPYRNDKLLELMYEIMSPSTQLCIACNLTGENEYIQTQTLASWKKSAVVIGKNPCVFLIGR
jgi:16S rRNA (cytidine1402-2'-O)-methyltransferase